MAEYVPVPVSAAEFIAREFSKSQVVIICYDSEHKLLHTTTFGVTPEDKEDAAAAGEWIAKTICGEEGFRRTRPYEDYRFIDQGKRAAENQALRRLCQSVDVAIEAFFESSRDGGDEHMLRGLQRQIRDTLGVRRPKSKGGEG